MKALLPSCCPQCNEEIKFLYQTQEIPYFSEILLITGTCSCGYRYVDTVILHENEPAEWIAPIECPEDLLGRVVRSNRGRLEIPELGIVVDPGPACEACVTNVEGILAQVEDVLGRILTWAEGEERERASELQDRLVAIREGKTPATLIIRDPSGNSVILGKKVKKIPLKEE